MVPTRPPSPTPAPSNSSPEYKHDETFLVTQGTLRFHALNGATIDAKLGDYVTVPPRAPHTFSNPYDEEAKFFNTFTPAFYINYFKLLAKMTAEGQPMNPEANRKAMAVSRLSPSPVQSTRVAWYIVPRQGPPFLADLSLLPVLCHDWRRRGFDAGRQAAVLQGREGARGRQEGVIEPSRQPIVQRRTRKHM
jgi:hypothetical protein